MVITIARSQYYNNKKKNNNNNDDVHQQPWKAGKLVEVDDS
jgi:hypothetical protein